MIKTEVYHILGSHSSEFIEDLLVMQSGGTGLSFSVEKDNGTLFDSYEVRITYDTDLMDKFFEEVEELPVHDTSKVMS